ncbi:MAG: hypothetical protein WCH39_18815 [Schlesneria sp.]
MSDLTIVAIHDWQGGPARLNNLAQTCLIRCPIQTKSRLQSEMILEAVHLVVDRGWKKKLVRIFHPGFPAFDTRK